MARKEYDAGIEETTASLRKQNRELKSENTQLRRKLKSMERDNWAAQEKIAGLDAERELEEIPEVKEEDNVVAIFLPNGERKILPKRNKA